MSILVRPDSGTKSRLNGNYDINKHINELQQQLAKSQAEARKVKDKLSCLISLVRRSWNGDRNASIHLANIVGLDVPTTMLDGGTSGRPASTASVISESKAVKNWERLTVRLLQHDYLILQTQIQRQQQQYIENRSRFMDEVLHFHQKDMSRLTLSRPPSGKLSSVDQQFLQHHSAVGPDGRNAMRARKLRPRSGIVHRRTSTGSIVEQADMRIRDLIVGSTSQLPLAPIANTTSLMVADAGDCLSTLGTQKEPLAVIGRRSSHQEYDDARRYVEGNPFNADELVSRKQLLISAEEMLERDRRRARPKSAVTANPSSNTANSEQAGDRPRKQEATRIVSAKRSLAVHFGGLEPAQSASGSSQLHPNSSEGTAPDTSGTASTAGTAPSAGTPPAVAPPLEGNLEDLGADPVSAQKPSISVRVKRSIMRPDSIDKFSDDLNHMAEMEAAFKKNALALQKRLGLPENGMV